MIFCSQVLSLVFSWKWQYEGNDELLTSKLSYVGGGSFIIFLLRRLTLLLNKDPWGLETKRKSRLSLVTEEEREVDETGGAGGKLCIWTLFCVCSDCVEDW